MATTINTIEFQGILISYDEDQTVGNCIDLGYGTEKIKAILNIMRSESIDYLSKRKLEQYRNL